MLEPKKRSDSRIWYAYGRIEYNGRPISQYYRASTGASSRQGAKDWIAAEEERVIRRHLTGEAEAPLSFAEAVMLYDATPEMAKHLIPLVELLGEELCKDISGEQVRALGPLLYPDNCTDSWRRHVITPVRAVINNAHDKCRNRCPNPISIKGYSKKQRIAQDMRRGRKSRVEKTPGGWEWLLKFREHANDRASAIALFMFITGARPGQATAMIPYVHLDLQNARACIPGAKGNDDRWVDLPTYLVVELANLKFRRPRGYPSGKQHVRVFGYAGKDGPRKEWHRACDAAGIEHIMPHAAGRHGFGQEMKIRQGIDPKAVAAAGGWSDTQMLDRTYTHAENISGKIFPAFDTGLAQAEAATGLKLLKNVS